jgi:hypothetical protein
LPIAVFGLSETASVNLDVGAKLGNVALHLKGSNQTLSKEGIDAA